MRRPFFLLFLLAALLMTAASPGTLSADEDKLSDAQRNEIEKLVHDYILAHPEVIVEAVRRMQEKEEREREEAARKNIALLENELLHDAATPSIGDPKADVTVVEFFDYRCAFCKRVLSSIRTLMGEDAKVRYVFKELPILGPDSVVAAKAALAVWRLDKDRYMDFHSALMTSKGGLPKAKIMGIAAHMGLDTAAIEREMESPDIEAAIRKTYELAEALNITGTPAFVIGNELVPGAADLATLRRLIGKARGS